MAADESLVTGAGADKDEFLTEFGLEGNLELETAADDGAGDDAGGELEGGGDAGAEVTGQDIGTEIQAETARLERFEGLQDNLAILAAQKPAAPAGKEGGDDDAAAGSADVSGDGAAGKAPAAAAAAAGAEGAAPDEGAPAAGGEGDYTAEEAQATFEYLMTNFGDSLQFSWKGNGEDRKTSYKDLTTAAAGYMGQGKVDETLKSATKERQEAEQIRARANAAVNELVELIDDPDRFVNELVLKSGEKPAEYLQALQKAVEAALDTIEKDPGQFEVSRRLDKLSASVAQLLTGKGGADEPQKPTTTAATATGEVPPDFGFKANAGYPKEYVPIVLASLDTAAQALGKSKEWVDQVVVKAWTEGGKVEPLPAVLQRLAKVEAADGSKLEAAGNPPIPRRPPNKSGTQITPGTKPAAKKAPAWNDIEKTLATSIAAAQKAGKV